MSEVYAMERERRTLEEAVERYAAQASPLVVLLALANLARLLYLIPEFSVFLARFWEIIWMPPELVVELYPTLYYSLLVASSTLPFAHLTFQALAARRKGVAVWVPEGGLAVANYILLFASYTSITLFAALSKDVGSILLWLLYLTLLVAGLNPTAREMLKRAYAPSWKGGERSEA